MAAGRLPLRHSRCCMSPPIEADFFGITPLLPLWEKGPGDEGKKMDQPEKWDIPPDLKGKMHGLARKLRRRATLAETNLWQAIRNRQLNGHKFRRQVPIGSFVVDFYCASERLAIEVDGRIHNYQREELIESLGISILRIKNEEIEGDLSATLERVRQAFH